MFAKIFRFWQLTRMPPKYPKNMQSSKSYSVFGNLKKNYGDIGPSHGG